MRLRRQQRCDVEQLAKRATLLWRKLAAETVRVKRGLTLIRRHLPQIAEGAGHHAAAIDRKRSELLHGSAKLLSLGRAEAFDGLVVFDQAAALLRRHIVELVEPVAQMFLRLRRKLAKAWLIAQSPLLLIRAHVAVAVHPLFEMLSILPSRPLSRVRKRTPLSSLATAAIAVVPAAGWASEGGSARREHKGSEC